MFQEDHYPTQRLLDLSKLAETRDLPILSSTIDQILTTTSPGAETTIELVEGGVEEERGESSSVSRGMREPARVSTTLEHQFSSSELVMALEALQLPSQMDGAKAKVEELGLDYYDSVSVRNIANPIA